VDREVLSAKMAKKKSLLEVEIDSELFHQEPDYVIKTRPPMVGDIRLNALRGSREQDLRKEAKDIAAKKCKEFGLELVECEKGKNFFTLAKCKPMYKNVQDCLQWESEVESDKMRRDMNRNPEWWWQMLYDENGEIGDQRTWQENKSFSETARDYYTGMSYLWRNLGDIFNVRHSLSKEGRMEASNASRPQSNEKK